MLYFLSYMRTISNVTARGIFFALIVVGAFFAGVSFGSGNSISATIAERTPLFGDGLDATPDESADLSNFWKVWNALESNYVITHASSTKPIVKEKIWGAMQGLAASYGDPYTTFFPPEEAQKFLEDISGTFGGVGMEIDVKDGVLTVVAPLKGTPAERAGVQPNDRIIGIDGSSTDGISLEAAVMLIRGEVGTNVMLTLVRGTEPLAITITRDIIQVPETEDVFNPENGVYRIALYEFSANSSKLFSQAFNRFIDSGARKLIIDLRGNPGGYLDSSVDIASHFLPKGAEVVTEDFGDKKEKNVHTSIGYNDLPQGTKVVVLIDGGSASASEILAGALQANEIATIVGSQSFGKGSVQQLIDIAGGSLKVTVARWVTPSGNWIMESGITPDIIVERTLEQYLADEDPQMDKAIEFLNEQ